MGTSTSFAQVAGKFQKLNADLTTAMPREAVGASALLVKRAVMANLGNPSGAPKMLRGVGKKGARIGVRYDVKSYPTNSTALVRAFGPFQLVERSTKPHRVPRERSKRKRRVVVIPGVGPRAWARHPGTSGKHPWAKGVATAIPLTERAFHDSMSASLRKVF